MCEEIKWADNQSWLFVFISEGMDSEPRWLLLFQQSAAADRRSDHPLHGAGTTGHRIRTTAGNDCVIRPQEHSVMYRHAQTNTPLIQNTSSAQKHSFTKGYDFIYCQSGCFVSYKWNVYHLFLLFSYVHLQIFVRHFVSILNDVELNWKNDTLLQLLSVMIEDVGEFQGKWCSV